MIETGQIIMEEAHGNLACYDCDEAVSISELEFVDDLIEHSPFFPGISENFSFCGGDDELFHDNIVNCCASSYAQIVQSMAIWDDDGRKREIGNLVRALRTWQQVPVKVIINAEHLLATLITIDVGAGFLEEDLAEALYCKSSALHVALDAIAI